MIIKIFVTKRKEEDRYRKEVGNYYFTISHCLHLSMRN